MWYGSICGWLSWAFVLPRCTIRVLQLLAGRSRMEDVRLKSTGNKRMCVLCISWLAKPSAEESWPVKSSVMTWRVCASNVCAHASSYATSTAVLRRLYGLVMSITQDSLRWDTGAAQSSWASVKQLLASAFCFQVFPHVSRLPVFALSLPLCQSMAYALVI